MENWKDIQGYEGAYQVSDLGRVRSLDRCRNLPNGKIRRDKGQMITPATSGKGYYSVSLSSSGYSKKFLVHRLVAQAFIENPYNKQQVNHIDGDKSNNGVSNLEWVTERENISHAFESGLIVRTRDQYRNMMVPVYCQELDYRFDSISSAVKYCREVLSHKMTDAKISECISGIRRTVYGMSWKRA